MEYKFSELRSERCSCGLLCEPDDVVLDSTEFSVEDWSFELSFFLMSDYVPSDVPLDVLCTSAGMSETIRLQICRQTEKYHLN